MLNTLPAYRPKPRYGELALNSELVVDRALETPRLCAIDEPGAVLDARHGARAGIAHLMGAPQRLPRGTHDRFTGAAVSGWDTLLRPPATFTAPERAHADLTVPGTLAELHDQFSANTVTLDDPWSVLVVADTVAPPLYGAKSLTIHVPDGIAVRALAGCAGHNEFKAVQCPALHAA